MFAKISTLLWGILKAKYTLLWGSSFKSLTFGHSSMSFKNTIRVKRKNKGQVSWQGCGGRSISPPPGSTERDSGLLNIGELNNVYRKSNHGNVLFFVFYHVKKLFGQKAPDKAQIFFAARFCTGFHMWNDACAPWLLMNIKPIFQDFLVFG